MRSGKSVLSAFALGLLNIAGTAAAGDVFDAASLREAKFSVRLLNSTLAGSRPDIGNGINAAGELVGAGTPFAGGGGVWWSSDGVMHSLPGYPNTTARAANAINAHGAIAGKILAGNETPVVWRRNRTTIDALPAPDPVGANFSSNGEGEAIGISAAGKVVGMAAYSGPLFSNWDYATVWEPLGSGGYAGRRLDTGLTPLGSPYGGGANDVSDTGLIAGNVAARPGVARGTAVVWDAAHALSYLPDPAVPQTILGTSGVAVADDGTVAGTVTYYISGAGGDYGGRPVVWEAAGTGGGYAARLLDAPAGSPMATIYTRDMTAGGDIVIGTGWAGANNTGATSGLLWTDDGTAIALTELLQDPSWVVSEALSVVADGDRLLISALLRPAGSAGTNSTPVPAVLTVTVPEPAGLATGALLLLSAIGRRRRR